LPLSLAPRGLSRVQAAEYIGVGVRDNTGTRTYRYLVEDVDRHGKVRIYFRRKGQAKVVLSETPGTPQFGAEYQRVFRGELNQSAAGCGLYEEGEPRQARSRRSAAVKDRCREAGIEHLSAHGLRKLGAQR
jgi:hypothetical protein